MCFVSFYFSCSIRPRAQTRKGQDYGGHAILPHEDPGVQGHVRDDGRRQDHRDHRPGSLRHVRLHAEQDGTVSAEGKTQSTIRFL